jgi:predicted NAD/FAD-dependent oxidoreductase
VRVFEKSRAPGGRAATRRTPVGQFDHGAQYATFRDPRTQPLVNAWRAQGLLAPWTARIGVHGHGETTAAPASTERLVAVPDMRALGEEMARGLGVQFGCTIAALMREIELPDARGRDALCWWLHDTDGSTHGPFDTVLITAPPPQALALLEGARVRSQETTQRLAAAAVPAGDTLASPDHAPLPRASCHAALSNAVMAPCLAALLVLPSRPAWPWDAAFVNDDPVLAWIARNASKPARGDAECWVLHATSAWSAAQLERAPDDTLPELLAAVTRVLGEPVTPVHATAHRWRFARPVNDSPSAAEACFDAELGVGVAGDWCLGGRVEGALLSGAAIAQRVQDAGGPVSTGVSD